MDLLSSSIVCGKSAWKEQGRKSSSGKKRHHRRDENKVELGYFSYKLTFGRKKLSLSEKKISESVFPSLETLQ